jgi:hypothetical protein
VKPWRLLRVILERLPDDSHYRAAQRRDPAFAQAYLARGNTGRPWRPRPEDWGLTELLLAGNFNRLGQVTALLADMPVAPKVKRRSKPPAPFPRPLTAIELATKAAEAAHHSAIENEVELAQQRWLTEQEKAG